MKLKWTKQYNDFQKEYNYSLELPFLGIKAYVEKIDKYHYDGRNNPENIGKWICQISADISIDEKYQELEKLHDTPEKAQQNAIEVAKQVINDQLKIAKEGLKQLERM
jgi:hypothetical protein